MRSVLMIALSTGTRSWPNLQHDPFLLFVCWTFCATFASQGRHQCWPITGPCDTSFGREVLSFIPLESDELVHWLTVGEGGRWSIERKRRTEDSPSDHGPHTFSQCHDSGRDIILVHQPASCVQSQYRPRVGRRIFDYRTGNNAI